MASRATPQLNSTWQPRPRLTENTWLCLWNGAVRRELVDRLWQHMRQLLGQFLYRQAGFLRQLLKQVGPQCPVHVLRRDRLVRSSAHPRPDGRAETVFLELIDDALDAAVLFQDVVHHRHHSGADDAAEQSIEHSHVHQTTLVRPGLPMKNAARSLLSTPHARVPTTQIQPCDFSSNTSTSA